jgi:hypothetical protein
VKRRYYGWSPIPCYVVFLYRWLHIRLQSWHVFIAKRSLLLIHVQSSGAERTSTPTRHFWPLELRISDHSPTAEAPALRVVFRTNAGKEILGGIRRRSVVPLCTPINLTRRREAAKGKPWIQVVDDCLNRFWLLARAVEDNCSTLRPIVVRQSLS